MLTVRGERVRVRQVSPQDVGPFRAAVEASRERIARWNPVDPARLQADLAEQSPTLRTFVVLADDPAGGHGLVGRINVSNIVRGRFCSGNLGYDAYDPYAGRGLFREGLGLVVTLAFAGVEDGGLWLHRLEANVQPGNARSAGVLRALGFRHEGFTPRMLYLNGPDGSRWRDHERFAVTSEEWPAKPYGSQARARRVVLLNGPPGDGRAALARELAAELALPLLSADAFGAADGAADGDGLWSTLATCPEGAVLAGSWPASSGPLVEARLRGVGLDPAAAVEVWCGQGQSLEVGPVVPVDVSHPLEAGALVRLALDVRAQTPPASVLPSGRIAPQEPPPPRLDAALGE